MDLASIRTEYLLKSLNVNQLEGSPLAQFQLWFDEAVHAKVNEPNAMNLATVNAENRPSARIVLLKGVDSGFVFYTNYASNKGHELAQNRFAALTFFWPELQRQIRIEGKTEKVSEAISDTYFLSRPRGSQIGAWASPQSQQIPNRDFLEQAEKKMLVRFEQEPLRRPPHWGGYRLVPDRVEFWQGRQSRLHDRIVYSLDDKGKWEKSRLAP
ncbi:pyridoxamine 5'-phosphate oxidase [Echinicola vietnamensis]|uniref:Pyridoxine/pyridoxamine 5'-phosphate oxidase n=1 Tax=Echinicola vietnamensis (strain DSM 17526 / LMG 23754 / KMM 6221) TaxID=926556 RepID=L0G0F1_ECHVK|nr:pyridoxamine 5'-phosphate oxidase [Echinicola vietnamensis]AGA79659.1 pyridoxamine-phosphate oxidase [Echinicola vietnamensis DSM 17526]